MQNSSVTRIGCHGLAVALCSLSFLLPSSVKAQDRVYPMQGVSVSGNIVRITPAQVVIEVRGSNQEFPMNEVRKVAFDNEPNALDRARDQVLEQQYRQALDELKRIDPAAIDNPLAKQDWQFYRWYTEGQLAIAGQGDKIAAAGGLRGLAAKNRNTHHLYELSELLGKLAMSLEQPEKAKPYFGLMEKAPFRETQLRANYLLAEVALQQGKVEEAKQRYRDVVDDASNSPQTAQLKSLAEVGLAICDQRAGNNEQALENLHEMVRKYDSTNQRLFARINNAKGACYEALQQWNQAVLSYLQTDLLFFTDKQAHAEALYRLTQLWPKIGEAARGAEARERLTSQYASSRWANR